MIRLLEGSLPEILLFELRVPLLECCCEQLFGVLSTKTQLVLTAPLEDPKNDEKKRFKKKKIAGVIEPHVQIVLIFRHRVVSTYIYVSWDPAHTRYIRADTRGVAL